MSVSQRFFIAALCFTTFITIVSSLSVPSADVVGAQLSRDVAQAQEHAALVRAERLRGF